MPQPASLCVSVHDVAPATWPSCERLLQLCDALGAGPLTLLVVPDFHRKGAFDTDPGFCRALDARLAHGDELALHGYYHLDDGPPPRSPREWFRRRVLTAAEGEFAGLQPEQARRRLDQGLAAFGRRGWPVEGFVAPAWQLGTAARAVLSEFPLRYTTTREGLWRLPDWRGHRSPSLVYSVRAGWRRALSSAFNEAQRFRLDDNPLLRISLHPADAAHPGVLAHWRTLIGRALAERTPMTKAAWAARADWR